LPTYTQTSILHSEMQRSVAFFINDSYVVPFIVNTTSLS